MRAIREKRSLVAISDGIVKNEHFYKRFWIWLRNSGLSTRSTKKGGIPYQLSMFQLEVMLHEIEIRWSDTGKIYHLKELDEEVIGDLDGRTIRNILETDDSGLNFRRKTRHFELIRQIFLMIQWENPEVARIIRK